MMKLKHLMIGYILITLLSACGGGESSSGSPPTATDPEGMGIVGTVRAPDNTTPISGATVYIPQTFGQSTQNVPDLGNCPPPSVPYTSYTCSAADGSFQLDAPAGINQLTLFIRKGFFATSLPVDLQGSNASLGDLPLPSNPDSGAGRFAVIEGAYDRMEDILAKLGMGELDPVLHHLIPGTETFAIYSDSTPLFQDNNDDGQADIFNFDVVFINCGQFDEEIILASHAQTLRDYVLAGGVLYVTDQAYDFVEQLFPDYLDFYGDDGVVATTAETMHLAETGEADIEVNATVPDPQLRNWLANVSCNGSPCLNPDNTVSIGGFLANWTVFHGGHSPMPSNVTIWTSGEIKIFDFSSGQIIGPVEKPLTATLNIGHGKILYSSYHTNELSFTAGFHPQERILQYLIFEL